MTGKYAVMMAGLPAAAYAMYATAKPENKKVVGGLLVSAALTSFLTGITEPIECDFRGRFQFAGNLLRNGHEGKSRRNHSGKMVI